MSAAVDTAGKDLVMGLGATGLSIARYLARNELEAAYFDTREEPPGLEALHEISPDAEVLTGDAKLPKEAGRLIVSPGIADTHPLIKKARKSKLEVISDIELFAREATAPFIAVTGSNGKSTVTTLLYHMCRAAGLETLAGGNLGEPALDLLDQEQPDIYVLELSSFQLQRTETLPAAVSILLNIAPDHLDWHKDEAEYREAKYRIFREAKSAVWQRGDNATYERLKHVDRAVSFGLDEPGEGHYGLREEEGDVFLARGENLLISASDLAMIGRHNQANALAALAAGELAGLDMPSMLQVLAEFPGLPHRMQFVRRVGSVDYINDSKATNVAAAIASVESVEGMLVLIAGGAGKSADFTPLAEALDGRLRAAVLIGEDAERIGAALDPIVPLSYVASMADAVREAQAFADADDTVLLAPACASLDQYDNYMARGDAFVDAVMELRR